MKPTVKTMHILLSSFFLLYFQLTHVHSKSSSKSASKSASTFTSHDIHDKDSTATINTINKFGHILNAESPHTADASSTSSDTSLQDEISTLHEPDFLLIGVVKSGSTSLYHYMVQHPQITGVQSSHLLPASMRDHITNIMKLRRAGKLPRIAKKKHSIILGTGGPNPQTTVKKDINEVNNFDLARMIKPIIDQKEVRFFDSFWYNHLQTITNQSLLLGWKWYLQVFDQESSDIIRGEASPTYFASSQFTAERIKLWLPNVKLILLLRNPVRRFVSHLKMIKENHAANMRFRRQRQVELENAKKNKGKNIVRRTLLEMEEMEQFPRMDQYNPFNSAYGQNQMNNMWAANNYMNNMNNLPLTPRTRYGARRKKKRPKQRLVRTRGEGQYNNFNNGRYQQLLTEIADEIDDEIAELDEDEIDDSGDHDDEYINSEANMYEQQRNAFKKRPQSATAPADNEANNEKTGDNAPKPPTKPVNKMEKIIGAIYKLSMYQVILVSSANKESQDFYSKRYVVGRDVVGFINRLLFGGIYTMRMKEWLKRFDSEHLFFRESSELFDDPVKLMGDLEGFLGVKAFGEAAWTNITGTVYNVELEKGKGYQHRAVDADEIEHWDISVEVETKIPHPTEDRKWHSQEIMSMLKDYYRAHNQQLSDLFDGKKYKDWDY